MLKKKWLAVLAVLAVAVALVAVVSVESQAAPPSPPVPCSIVLCPAPPPTCPPGQVLGIPPGQCCLKCVPSK